jgi:DNA-binding CsgD family transcriptional regulator
MIRERCLHTNIASGPGIKLNEYTGNGTPVCISHFLNSEKHHSNVSDELKSIQSFIDKIPIPVFYKNVEGKYSGCNNAFLEFIGDSDPSSQISEYKHRNEEVERNCVHEMELLKINGSRVCESIIKRKNGEIKYALINKATITNGKGEACGLIGMISDITTNRLLKDALNTSAGNTAISRDEHFQELTNIKQLLFDENKKRRELEKKLAQASRKVEEYIKKNAESSIAMKAILEYQENYKKELEDNLILNVRHLIIPYILKLKRNRVSSDDLNCLKIIESKLDEIVSPLSNKLSSKHKTFTPREIQIADLIKDGMQDKDIMKTINISIDTVKTHRKNIRRKLGIYGDRSNLRSTLLTLSS